MHAIDTIVNQGREAVIAKVKLPVPKPFPTMAKCETCGNDYDRAFTVTMGGQTHTFDSFECAIQQLAPTCSHCECRIIGHGVESDGEIFCCVHCASHAGKTSLRDRE